MQIVLNFGQVAAAKLVSAIRLNQLWLSACNQKFHQAQLMRGSSINNQVIYFTPTTLKLQHSSMSADRAHATASQLPFYMLANIDRRHRNWAPGVGATKNCQSAAHMWNEKFNKHNERAAKNALNKIDFFFAYPHFIVLPFFSQINNICASEKNIF